VAALALFLRLGEESATKGVTIFISSYLNTRNASVSMKSLEYIVYAKELEFKNVHLDFPPVDQREENTSSGR